MLPGVAGSCECYFKQFVSLSPKGLRLIACTWPSAVNSHEHFVSSFSRLLEELSIDKCHLFGTSVGGYLAQVFAGCDTQQRVQSMILCNGCVVKTVCVCFLSSSSSSGASDPLIASPPPQKKKGLRTRDSTSARRPAGEHSRSCPVSPCSAWCCRTSRGRTRRSTPRLRTRSTSWCGRSRRWGGRTSRRG
jgi:pimeloyl-ACP methyl ester carboxylesterase